MKKRLLFAIYFVVSVGFSCNGWALNSSSVDSSSQLKYSCNIKNKLIIANLAEHYAAGRIEYYGVKGASTSWAMPKTLTPIDFKQSLSKDENELRLAQEIKRNNAVKQEMSHVLPNGEEINKYIWVTKDSAQIIAKQNDLYPPVALVRNNKNFFSFCPPYLVESDISENGTVHTNFNGYDDQAELYIFPNKGFSITEVSGCGGSLSGNVYRTAKLNRDSYYWTKKCSVQVKYHPNGFDLSIFPYGKGSIEPSTTFVSKNQTASINFYPGNGYEFEKANLGTCSENVKYKRIGQSLVFSALGTEEDINKFKQCNLQIHFSKIKYKVSFDYSIKKNYMYYFYLVFEKPKLQKINEKWVPYNQPLGWDIPLWEKYSLESIEGCNGHLEKMGTEYLIPRVSSDCKVLIKLEHNDRSSAVLYILLLATIVMLMIIIGISIAIIIKRKVNIDLSQYDLVDTLHNIKALIPLSKTRLHLLCLLSLIFPITLFWVFHRLHRHITSIIVSIVFWGMSMALIFLTQWYSSFRQAASHIFDQYLRSDFIGQLYGLLLLISPEIIISIFCWIFAAHILSFYKRMFPGLGTSSVKDHPFYMRLINGRYISGIIVLNFLFLLGLIFTPLAIWIYAYLGRIKAGTVVTLALAMSSTALFLGLGFNLKFVEDYLFLHGIPYVIYAAAWTYANIAFIHDNVWAKKRLAQINIMPSGTLTPNLLLEKALIYYVVLGNIKNLGTNNYIEAIKHENADTELLMFVTKKAIRYIWGQKGVGLEKFSEYVIDCCNSEAEKVIAGTNIQKIKRIL